MSAPIRSASVSPYAARPQVHSRRVSLRVGAFGLTYSTDRVLWNAAPAAPMADPQPVDPAPSIESERPENQAETSATSQDLEAARKLGLWAVAQERAARQLTLAGQATSQQAAGQSSDGQAAGVEQGPGAAQTVSQGTGPVAETQAKPDPAQGDTAQGDAAQTGGSSGGRALAQAMRRAAQAYQSCQSCFAGSEPMLQAVA